MKGILPDILSPRGPLIECPGSGGKMALSTSPSTLASLCKPLPRSKSAIKQMYHQHLKKWAVKDWKKSPQFSRMTCIDACLPSPAFPALIANLSQKHTSLLIQLCTLHIPLAKHLYCIGKAESPICPCCWQHKETVYHYISQCPAHHNACTKMLCQASRGASSLKKLFSSVKMLPHLFCFIGQSSRLHSVFGDVTSALP